MQITVCDSCRTPIYKPCDRIEGRIKLDTSGAPASVKTELIVIQDNPSEAELAFCRECILGSVRPAVGDEVRILQENYEP